MEQSFLLETGEVITKRGIFYKVGQVLKSESNIITKQGNFALLESGAFLFQSVANNLLQSEANVDLEGTKKGQVLQIEAIITKKSSAKCNLSVRFYNMMK